MSYEVLARRLRPTTFADVVGQSHVTTTLCNALRSDRLPHAILLCGPRGVGKTSIARILARSLNCDEGPTEKPCGTCRACVDIANSTSMDVQEIDAASHTGVENVREIRESIRFSAAPGKHRIFIIDEVHMLSQAAFNALLKTLEEPPPRSLFIFATTDPQKMPATVLSRVQRFDLRRLPAAELLESLQRIAAAESLEISEKVLRALIREGEGSFRDVLTLLDRLVSGLGAQIDEARATEILGWIDRSHTRAIVDAVLAHDPAASLVALERALEHGADPARLASELLEELRDLLVARLIEDPAPLIDAPHEELEELRERARPHDPETLQRTFRVLLSRIPDLGFAPHPGHALEVAIVRLATLPSAESLTALLQRLDGLEPAPAPAPTPGGSRSGGGSGSGAKARTAPSEPARRSVARAGSATAAPLAATSEGVAEVTTPSAPSEAPPASVQAKPLVEDRSEPAPLRPAVAAAEVTGHPAAVRSSPQRPGEPGRPEPAALAHHGLDEPAFEEPGSGEEDSGEQAFDEHCPEAQGAELAADPGLPRRAQPERAAAPTLRDSDPLASGARTGARRGAPRPDADALRALRTEAKQSPAVLRIVELLDAEIRDLRLPRST